MTGWLTGTRVPYQYGAFLDCIIRDPGGCRILLGQFCRDVPTCIAHYRPSSNELVPLLSSARTLFCRGSGQHGVILSFSPVSPLPGGLRSNALSQEGPLQPVCLSGVPTGALHDPPGLPVLSHAGER